MKFNPLLSTAIIVILANLLFSSTLYAHVMVAQQGTLNIKEDGVYMVISVPVSAFSGIDDDEDGKLSSEEFALHRPAIIKTVQSNIMLKDETAELALKGLMLSPVLSHHAPNEPATQLVVMGRFSLDNANNTLEYQVNLFGKSVDEKKLKITVTRKQDASKQVFEINEKKPKIIILKAEALAHLRH